MREDVDGVISYGRRFPTHLVSGQRLRMAHNVRPLSWGPHPGKQPRLGTRPLGMHKIQGRGDEEDGGILCALHGEHWPAGYDEKVDDNEGQRQLDQIRDALEVDSATRSCCHLSMRNFTSLFAQSWLPLMP
ncbi:hypothetical protein HBI52_016720 [Parastagonospora nodorum]|nr:hypothetical protein HBI05_135780 [Parastagonospora nodorum]KAH4242296.1 hypothetical protein HBI06_015700 [Parastagonospora nodorum]KAH5085181.1 hypothetical protein HBH95_022450 [Parastagonospora nodorum]KAH5198804.1 hypothetical protein HBH76_022680 [Parastagonospora nodorum]KAH5322036.1 hypothetical protein HBI50_107580 [Parastagonospora nodorum]